MTTLQDIYTETKRLLDITREGTAREELNTARYFLNMAIFAISQQDDYKVLRFSLIAHECLTRALGIVDMDSETAKKYIRARMTGEGHEGDADKLLLEIMREVA